ncbi:MAG: DUF3140 domain-containing protein [Ahrensia sp.]
MSTSKSKKTVWGEWRDLVNMAPTELSDWLQTDESQSVGSDSGDGESIGHKSGERIVDILQTDKDDLSQEDWEHMAKVVGYIKRHTAQSGPDDDVENSAWRYSLMNWGHDPLKAYTVICPSNG